MLQISRRAIASVHRIGYNPCRFATQAAFDAAVAAAGPAVAASADTSFQLKMYSLFKVRFVIPLDCISQGKRGERTYPLRGTASPLLLLLLLLQSLPCLTTPLRSSASYSR